MNYRFFLIFFFTFVLSCTNQNFSKKKVTDQIIFQKYTNSGFTLIYSDELIKNKIVSKN